MFWLVACAQERVPVAMAPPEERVDETPRGALQFRLPLAQPELFEQTVGVDHDPVEYSDGLESAQCVNYDGRGFPWCYDRHDGSDYLLDGGFDTMDAGSTDIVAAADGVVYETDDGNYDRCEATLEGVDCDGYPMEANYVILQHEGGWFTLYWHMKTDSVAVEPGQEIRCGEVLGKVGSSGYSSMPHLHFELQDSTGLTIDPYAGPHSQPETWWAEQGDPEGLPGADCG
jgi:hypothetical protein